MPGATTFLAIGDPHFKVSNIKDARLFRERIKEKLLQLRPKYTVILGDLHNDFERIHSSVMAEICDLFRAILDTGTILYYIIGNHDAINNQIFLSEDHAFLPFKKWPGLVIVDRPAYVDGFLMIPYVPPGRFRDALNTYPQAVDPKAIFCHQEFRGVQLGPLKSVHGDEWPEDAPLVVSGHIHERQWLQKNVLYVGAPFDQGFGEEGDKSITLLTFSEDGQLCKEEQCSLDMPSRLTLHMTIEELKVYQKPENAYVRVYLSGTTEGLVAFKKSKEYKKLSQELKIIPKPTDTVVVRKNESGKGFLSLLRELVEGESESVKEALREIGLHAPSS